MVIMPRAELLRHTVIVLSVDHSVCLSFTSISRRSLKTKRWNKQHKQVSIFARICTVLKIWFWSLVRKSWIYTRFVALAGDLDFSEDKSADIGLPASL